MSSVVQPVSAVISDTPERQHYRNAPIVEAILDVRLTPSPDLRIEALRAMAEAERSFPAIDNTFVVEAAATFGANLPRASASANQQLTGFRIRDDSGRRAAHLDRNRFAFSKYHPYDRWETFRDAARDVWQRYAACVRPMSIQRLALRYVNRIDIPLPAGDLKEWLLTVPDVNPLIAPGVSSYVMELHLPQVDLPRTVAIMRQALVAPQRPDAISIVLDLEVVRGVELGDSESDLETIWQMFEGLHTRENQIFERTITDRVRERIR